MSLHYSVNINGITLRILGGTSTHQISTFFERYHHIKQLTNILFLIFFEFNLLWESACHIGKCQWNFASNDILIATIEFCISLFQNISKYLFFILASTEKPLISSGRWKFIIDDYKNILSIFTKLNHKRAFCIFPLPYSQYFFNHLYIQNTDCTYKIAVSNITLSHAHWSVFIYKYTVRCWPRPLFTLWSCHIRQIFIGSLEININIRLLKGLAKLFHFQRTVFHLINWLVWIIDVANLKFFL